MRARERAGPWPSQTAQLAALALDEEPVDVERHTAHLYTLVHLVADPRRALVGPNQATVNRDPVVEAAGVLVSAQTREAGRG